MAEKLTAATVSDFIIPMSVKELASETGEWANFGACKFNKVTVIGRIKEDAFLVNSGKTYLFELVGSQEENASVPVTCCASADFMKGSMQFLKSGTEVFVAGRVRIGDIRRRRYISAFSIRLASSEETQTHKLEAELAKLLYENIQKKPCTLVNVTQRKEFFKLKRQSLRFPRGLLEDSCAVPIEEFDLPQAIQHLTDGSNKGSIGDGDESSDGQSSGYGVDFKAKVDDEVQFSEVGAVSQN